MARSTVPLLVSTLAASALASAVACHTGSSATTNDDNGPDAQSDAGMPFQALTPPRSTSPRSRTSSSACPRRMRKIEAVQADSTQIGSLIDGWMQLPLSTSRR